VWEKERGIQGRLEERKRKKREKNGGNGEVRNNIGL